MSTPSTSRACARDHSPERKRTWSPFRLRARTPRAGGALGRRRRRGRTRSARGPGRGRRRHPRSPRFAGGGAGFEDAERRVPRRAQPIHPRQGAGRRHRLRERARGRRLQHSDGYVARDGARVERSRPAARFRADRWSRRARRALLSGSGAGRRRRAFAVYRRRLDRRQSGARCADDAPPRPLSRNMGSPAMSATPRARISRRSCAGVRHRFIDARSTPRRWSPTATDRAICCRRGRRRELCPARPALRKPGSASATTIKFFRIR